MSIPDHNPNFLTEHRFPTGIAEHLQADGFDAGAAARVEALAEQLRLDIVRFGPSGGVDRFLAEPTRWADQAERFAVVRIVELVAGADFAAMARPAWTAPGGVSKRPLLEIELGLVTTCALVSTSRLVRRKADVALVQVAHRASARECANVEPMHVTRTPTGSRVELPGAGRANDRRRRCARSMEVGLLGGREIADLAATPAVPFVLHPDGRREVGEAKRESAVSGAVGRLLTLAGLASDPSVSFASIGLGAARLVAHDPDGFEGTHGSEAAAAWLGLTNFQYAADLCRYRDNDFDPSPI